jgi:hypothetical protein
MTKAEIKRLMSYLGKKTSKAKTAAARANAKLPRKRLVAA